MIVHGTTPEIANSALKRITHDEELAQWLVPSPVPVRTEGARFGMSAAVQEFIIAAGAGVTVEALVAAVRAALPRREEADQNDRGRDRISITATPRGSGVIEVTVTVEKQG